METIGERIYRLRKKRGLSQDALGKMVGVSKQAIGQWEKNQVTDYKEGKFAKLVKALDTTPLFLKTGRSENVKTLTEIDKKTRSDDLSTKVGKNTMFKTISKLCGIQDETYIEIISDLIKVGRCAEPAQEIRMLANSLLIVADYLEEKRTVNEEL